MPKMKLTARGVENIKPPTAGQVDYWDTSPPGFGLRVSPTGRKSWVLMYRHGGRKRRLTIGTYPSIPLAAARERAIAALSDVAQGQDPAGIKQAERRADTFAELAEDYMRRHAMVRKRSWQQDRRALNRDLLPRFAHRKAASIKRREVIDLLDGIKERGAPILANRTLEIMRKIYNWGISREIVETNPCQRIERPSAEVQRQRVLNDDEIRAVWRAFDQEPPYMSAMFKLRVLTAQRGGEIAHMRWKDIDVGAGWWTIPGEYTKNGLAHRVPLSPEALEVLGGVEEHSNGSSWVFPQPSGEGPITVIWKAVDRVRRRAGVQFVLHDLRRTAASRMTGDLGIGRLTVSKILNHVERGVTAVYDRHSYDAEKRQALEAWGQRLEEIVSGRAAKAASNIVGLPGVRR